EGEAGSIRHASRSHSEAPTSCTRCTRDGRSDGGKPPCPCSHTACSQPSSKKGDPFDNPMPRLYMGNMCRCPYTHIGTWIAGKRNATCQTRGRRHDMAHLSDGSRLEAFSDAKELVRW